MTIIEIVKLGCYIYMDENLTSMNKMLLGEDRNEGKRLKHEFPGYAVNGQVRVKKSKISEYMPINTKQEIK